MAYQLKVLKRIEEEPVSLDEARDHLGFFDTDRDDYVAGLISAARQTIETMTSRALARTTFLYTLPRFPHGQWITMPRAQLIELESLKYVDQNEEEQEFDLEDLQVDTVHKPGRIGRAYNVAWPGTSTWNANPVQIEYVAGYEGEVPQNLRHGLLIMLRYFAESGELDTIPRLDVWESVETLVQQENWGHYV